MMPRSLGLLILTFALLGGCAPTVANRGNLLDPERLAQVKVGTSTREDVANQLGTPTQVSTFDEKTWYYFGQHTEQFSFLDPEIKERQAIAVEFDDAGVVTALNKLNTDNTEAIAPVDRRTPTYGRETTFLEQLVGNLGRPGGTGKGRK